MQNMGIHGLGGSSMKKQEDRDLGSQKSLAKTCFVIMPFGKAKDSQDTSMAIYRSIIRPAVEEAGYAVSRMDVDMTKVGSITRNIIHSLVDADLVIADLTDANANVLYELGIRHALKKCATVMIIQEGEPIPFDLSDYGVTFYSKALERMERSIKLISEAIRKSERAQLENQSDNPVFAHYPSIEFAGGQSEDTEILAKVDQLTAQNTRLREVLDKNGISFEENTSKEKALLALLEAADKAMEDSGPGVMLELQKAANHNDIAMFTANIKKVLTSEFLTERRLIELSRLCDQMGLIPHRIVVLTEAYEHFPNSYDVIGLLADAYSDHPDTQQKRKGCGIIERAMCVQRKDGSSPFADKNTVIERELLMGLFNVYISMQDWDAIITFCDSTKGLNINGNDSIILRNAARAYVEKREYVKAQEALKEAIEDEPDNDSLHTMLSELYRKMGEYEKAFEAQEQAVLLDPDDMNNFINLSIDILNNGMYRDENGKITLHGRKARVDEAVAIYKHILEQNPPNSIRSRIVEILSRRGKTKEAEEVLTQGKFSSDGISYEMKYLLNRVSIS
jgi:tetratricopeptide (TPR) repeat protein